MTQQTYQKTTQLFLDKIKCPYQVFLENTPEKEVNKAYQESLARGKKEGFLPLLVVVDDLLVDCINSLDENEKKSILEQNIDAEKLLKSWYKSWYSDSEYDEEDNDKDNENKEDDIDEEESYKDLDSFLEKVTGEEINSFSSFSRFGNDKIAETILFEIPVTNPWELIAWVPFGGWNECPCAEDMIAICKRWYEQHGAIPAVISSSTIEFLVERPIQEKETAYKIAKEHYAFCPDRVDQCTETGTLAEVAATLYQASVWYFWWD